MLHGAADDLTPVAPCREYAERLSKAGKSARIIEYPDAYHQFDAPVYRTAIKFEQAPNPIRRCRLEEGENGASLNVEAKQPLAPSDSCYEKGFTGAFYQEAAANKAHEDVKAFLKELFRMQGKQGKDRSAKLSTAGRSGEAPPRQRGGDRMVVLRSPYRPISGAGADGHRYAFRSLSGRLLRNLGKTE